MKTEGCEEGPSKRDDLDVEVWIVGAEHFGDHLVELAVPPTMRLLVADCKPVYQTFHGFAARVAADDVCEVSVEERAMFR